jgi:hypothetical protein
MIPFDYPFLFRFLVITILYDWCRQQGDALRKVLSGA